MKRPRKSQPADAPKDETADAVPMDRGSDHGKKQAKPAPAKKPKDRRRTTKHQSKVGERKNKSLKPPKAAANEPREEKKNKKKKKKLKLVEDTFTMPETDFELIAKLKNKCFVVGIVAKKNDLLRLGLRMLDRLSMEQLEPALKALVR